MANENNNFDLYKLQRQRLGQEKTVESQRQQEALRRRAASQGRLGSGAIQKQSQVVEQNIGGQYQKGLESINTAESLEKQRRQEILQGQGFQKELQKSGQDFAGGQAALERGERARQFDESSKTQKSQFLTEMLNSRDQFRNTFREQARQFKAGYDLEREAQIFNAALSEAQLGKKLTIWDSLASRLDNSKYDLPPQGYTETNLTTVYDNPMGDIDRLLAALREPIRFGVPSFS
jgi:hypothetical protein